MDYLFFCVEVPKCKPATSFDIRLTEQQCGDTGIWLWQTCRKGTSGLAGVLTRVIALHMPFAKKVDFRTKPEYK